MINLRNYKFENHIYSDPYRRSSNITTRMDMRVQNKVTHSNQMGATRPAIEPVSAQAAKGSKKHKISVCGIVKTIGLAALVLVGGGFTLLRRGHCMPAIDLAVRLNNSPFTPAFLRSTSCNLAKGSIPYCGTTQEKLAGFLQLEDHCFPNAEAPKSYFDDPKWKVLNPVFRSALKEWPLDNAKEIADLMPDRQLSYISLKVAYWEHFSKTQDIGHLAEVIKMEANPELGEMVLDIYRNILKDAERSGNSDFALQVLSELKSKSQFIERLSSDIDFNVRLILMSNLSNRCEIAEKMADFIEHDQKVLIYDQIYRILVETNEVEKAKAFNEKIISLKNSKNLDSFDLRFNVGLLCAEEKYQEAEEEARLIRDPVQKLLAYRYLHNAYKREGKEGSPALDKINELDFSAALRRLPFKPVLTADIREIMDFAKELGMDEMAENFEQVLIEKEKEDQNSPSWWSKFSDAIPAAESSSREEHYKTLGVSSGATQAEIRAAYRQLSLQYHPDKNKDPDSQAKFIEIGKAYEALTSNEKN